MTSAVLKRWTQVLLLGGFALYGPHLGARVMLSCAEFIDISEQAAETDCGQVPTSGSCACSEDGNGNVIDGQCFFVC